MDQNLKTKIPRTETKPPSSSRSGISKSKSKPKSDSGVPNSKARSDPSRQDTESKSVHASLTSLGVNVPLEEFTRLYRGPLADALLFVSEHVRGRREVAEARREIYRLRQERSKSHIKHPSERDLLRTEADRALSVLNSTQQTVQITRQQVDERMGRVFDGQREVTKLEGELLQKRKVALLLEILEKRERLRVERFEALRRMMSDLTNKTENSVLSTQIDPAHLEDDNHKGGMIRLTSRRINTRRTLAALHAYHLRLSSYPTPVKSGDREEQGKSGRDTTKRGDAAKSVRGQVRDELVKLKYGDVDNVMERLERVARRRVNAKSSPLREKGGGGRGVDEVFARVKAKEQAIQELLDRSVALAYLSEGYIRSIASFREQTAPVLKEGLGEEAKRVSGWVDKLRAGVRDEGAKEEDGFNREVMCALGLEGSMNTAEIVKHVQKLAQRNHDREMYIERLRAVSRSRSPTREERDLIEKYRAQQLQWRDRAEKLLRRKSDKADAGMGIVRDVDEIVRETRSLCGG